MWMNKGTAPLIKPGTSRRFLRQFIRGEKAPRAAEQETGWAINIIQRVYKIPIYLIITKIKE
jgi:hypothetical protein